MKFFFIVMVSIFFFSATSFSSDSDFNLQYKHAPDQLFVKLKDGTPSSERDSLLKEFNAHIAKTFRSSGAMLLKFKIDQGGDGENELLDIARRINARDDVDYVEANNVVELQDTMPNDTRFAELWNMRKISAPGAWDINTGSKKVVVAVIDSGILYDHPDVVPNLWKNSGEMGLDAQGRDKASNKIDDDKNGYVDDWQGWDFLMGDNDVNGEVHGSHCAGIIGAVGNNGLGVVGINWNVSLMSLKIVGVEGSGLEDIVIEAIEYATKMRVHIINASFGTGGPSETMRAAIQAAGDVGILFVAAAGNRGVNADEHPFYPAAFDLDNIISVANSDNKDEFDGLSNYGLKSVDLAAPGVDILSLGRNGGYTLLTGTSMAAPHVAGAAALIKAVYPNMTHLQIKERILNSVDLIPGFAGKLKTGGRLNVKKALLPSAVD